MVGGNDTPPAGGVNGGLGTVGATDIGATEVGTTEFGTVGAPEIGATEIGKLAGAINARSGMAVGAKLRPRRTVTSRKAQTAMARTRGVICSEPET